MVHEDVQKSILLELESFGNRIVDTLGAFSRFNDFKDDSQVRWLDYRVGRGGDAGASVGFSVAPILVADELRYALLDLLYMVLLALVTLLLAGRGSGERSVGN